MTIVKRLFRTASTYLQAVFPSFTRLMLAGGCAILAISYPSFWFLAPVALAVFFVDIWKARSLGGALLRGFIFGLASGGAGIWWFWDTLPLDWIGLTHGPNEWYFVFASWGPVSLVLAFAVMPAAWLLWILRESPYKALAAVPIWVIAEELRMWNFSFLTYAGRSLLGPHFSSASIGYPLAENHYLLQLATGGGIQYLNAVVALMAGVLALCILRISWKTKGFKASLGVLVIVLLVPLVLQVPPRVGKALEAVLVSTRIPVGTKDLSTGERYLSILREANKTYPSATVFVLPEEMRLESNFTNEDQHRKDLNAIFGPREVLIISSRHERLAKSFHTALIYENQDGQTLASYRKLFLMPGGEYMPYLMLAVFSLRPDTGLGYYINNLPANTDARTGVVSLPFNGHILGGLICSDFLSPHLYRELAVAHGADVLINSANPAWFHHSRLLYDKTVQIAKVHAVQNRTYFLQASNGDPAFAIDASGRMISELPWNQEGMLRVTIPGEES